MMHDDELTADAELLAGSPPPRRWAWDSVGGPMGPGQRLNHERLIEAARIPEGDLPDHVRLVLRWVAAGDTIVCTGLADLLDAAREAGFDDGFNHP